MVVIDNTNERDLGEPSNPIRAHENGTSASEMCSNNSNSNDRDRWFESNEGQNGEVNGSGLGHFYGNGKSPESNPGGSLQNGDEASTSPTYYNHSMNDYGMIFNCLLLLASSLAYD